jgi:hypothetical protein
MGKVKTPAVYPTRKQVEYVLFCAKRLLEILNDPLLCHLRRPHCCELLDTALCFGVETVIVENRTVRHRARDIPLGLRPGGWPPAVLGDIVFRLQDVIDEGLSWWGRGRNAVEEGRDRLKHEVEECVEMLEEVLRVPPEKSEPPASVRTKEGRTKPE